MVWSLALCPDDAKQDPVVYGAEFGVVFLAKGPRTASIQEGLDCIDFYHSSLEGKRYFLMVHTWYLYISWENIKCLMKNKMRFWSILK